MKKLDLKRLDEIDSLPYNIGIGKNKAIKGWWRNHSNGTWHNIEGVNPWVRVKRLLMGSIGLKFNDIFRKYCKQVPKYQQSIFLDQFEWNFFPNMRYYNDYYVDDDGLIQLTKKIGEYKGPYKFVSLDAKYERRHKVTGKKEPEYTWVVKGYDKNDYESVLISGYELYFDSKNDPRYIRLKAEKNKQQSRERKARYGPPKLTLEDFRRILREKELKEKELNLIKIESHGFDAKRSFRKEKNGILEH